MAPDPTHYELLEIPSSADDKAVRRAYRRQAQRWHPDRNGGTAEANDRFVQIQRAYEVLSSPQHRQRYDEALFRPAPPPTPPQPVPKPSVSPAAPVRKGDSLHVFTSVPLELLVQGGQVSVKGRVGARCPRCMSGCPQCGYAGQVLMLRRWVISVPRGHRPDQWLCFYNAGHSGPFFSIPGDVLIQLRPRRSHGWAWSWDRARLERVVRVPSWFLRQGGQLEFRAPNGVRGHARVPPVPNAQSVWVFIRGPGLGEGPGLGMWIHVKVGLWFSWGTRRFSGV